MTPDEPRERSVWWKFAAGGLLMVLLTAAATATAGLLAIKDVADRIPKLAQDVPVEPTKPGKPQTLLLLGSDRRYVDRNSKNAARSDTIMLIRLDPGQEATTLLSIPRDLKTEIPGYGYDKINSAYSLGGPKLTLRTVKELLGIKVNHIINVNFSGFRKAVDLLGCVYTDVDRRYYHSNAGLPASVQYAEINIRPGYQKLCGKKALDYVRFRHADSDLVRAARQQDFLRQAKDQIGVSRIFGDREALLKIFGKYTQTDIRGTTAILRLLKLVAQSASHPVQEIHFPGDEGPTYVTTTRARLKRAVHDFLNAKGSSVPRGKAAPARNTPHRKRTHGIPRGLVLNKTLGEDQAIALQTHLHFAVYYPKLLAARGNYRVPDRRAYDIYDRGGHKYRAYRIVAFAGDIGQYYGVQGTTWSSPPILDNPSETRSLNGRKFELFFDGGQLRLVAYRTKKAVYWVSNTLLETLSNKQMLGLAESLTRVGH